MTRLSDPVRETELLLMLKSAEERLDGMRAALKGLPRTQRIEGAPLDALLQEAWNNGYDETAQLLTLRARVAADISGKTAK